MVTADEIAAQLKIRFQDRGWIRTERGGSGSLPDILTPQGVEAVKALKVKAEDFLILVTVNHVPLRTWLNPGTRLQSGYGSVKVPELT